MFDEIDRAYYQCRAAEERRRASITLDQAAARTHQAMAEEYERRIANLTPPGWGPRSTGSGGI